MPVLMPPAEALIRDARFTMTDLVALKQSNRPRASILKDAIALARYFPDALEAGVGQQLRSLLRELGSNESISAPITNLSGETGLLNDQVLLPDDGRRHASVRSIQRALIALANRKSTLAYMLPKYGADGSWGRETELAVRAFQWNAGVPVTGKVDGRTARVMDRILRGTVAPGTLNPSSADLFQAALELCREPLAFHYGVPLPWINIDPYHAVPVNRPFEPMRNRWKCNLYGGNVLRKAGYEPPYYGNSGRGEYPNANQWFKWSDRYATQYGNPVHFRLIDEVVESDLSTMRGAIAALLSKAQPGDFLLQDHPGSQIANGGHTRVAIANQFRTNGTISFAQAAYERAEVQEEGVDDLIPSERIWLLRPVL